METTVQADLAVLPDRAIRRVSRALAHAFSRDLLIGTLHGGKRLEDDDEDLRDDLDALAAALPEGRLSRDAVLRDAASGEATMITAIRQAEGSPPALPAVLLPRSAEEAQAFLAEASAAGFEPGPGGARRPIGLSFSGDQRAEGPSDAIRIGAGTSWDDLAGQADHSGAGLPFASLEGEFRRPIDAVTAGLTPGSHVEWFRGIAVCATLPLPPDRVGATDHAWFVPAETALDLLQAVSCLFEPLYAEVLSPTDALVLHAAGLIDPPPRGRAMLRIAVQGTRGVRAATMKAVARTLLPAGGRLCRRGPLPGAARLESLAACSGAARLVLPTAPDSLPPAGVVARSGVCVRGQVRERTILWYPRDLSRSVDQAIEVPGAPPTSVRTADDDSWNALRAALAEALP